MRDRMMTNGSKAGGTKEGKEELGQEVVEGKENDE